MSKDKNKPVEIEETALDEASGGLPAVQKAREAAARIQSSGNTAHGAGGGGGAGKVSMHDIG